MTQHATGAPESRRPGRPRSARVHHAILASAVDLFVELGLEGMSIEAVADRAGVGKAAIYRRWSSKDDLVAAAFDEEAGELQLPDTGSLQGDLASALRQFHNLLTGTKVGRALPRMVGEIRAGSPLGIRYAETMIVPRRELAAQLVRRGIERGDLAPDTDEQLLIDALVGAVMVRFLTSALGQEVPADLPERIVQLVLAGSAHPHGRA
ncbi:MAG: TetR/AcrR family transcriptional regulator [Actinomycetota bacterium]